SGYMQKISFKSITGGGITLEMLSASSICVVVCNWLEKKIGMPGAMYCFVADSNKVLAVLLSISSFLYFKNLRLKYIPWVNILGGSTFGVLLIHANSDTMRRWLWKDILNNVGMFDSRCLVVHAIMSTMGVFAICSMIDVMRVRYIEKPLFSKLDFENNRFVTWWKSKVGNL
ncbi:MAG: hypothetical protein IJ381_07355, partial [Clostridia bacterium]|nr:hypothetical protein [Clostridia bacterium]